MSIDTTIYDVTTREAIEHSPAENSPGIDIAKVEEFATKVAIDQAAASNAVLAHLGDRLGIWRTLATSGSVTSEELAQRTGLAERYLREWLAAQAAAGYVVYDKPTRRYTLPGRARLRLRGRRQPGRKGRRLRDDRLHLGVGRPAGARLRHG